MHLSHIGTARRSSRVRGWAAVVLTVATLTACSSSGSGGSTPSDKTKTSASANTAATSSSASAGGQGNSVSASLTAATTRPTQIPITTPIGKAIPAGKSVYYINCGVEGCAIFGRIIAQAGAALNWNVKLLGTDGSPGQIANAWQTAIRAKPFAIVTVGNPLAQVNNFIKQAAAQGIAVEAVGVPQTTWPNVLSIVDNADQAPPTARALASYVAGDAASSGLKNPGVVFVNTPDFPIVNQYSIDFQKDMPSLCSGCKVNTLSFGLANFAQAPSQIVSYLRSHSDVRYVVYGADNFPAATEQIAAAGIKVKLVTTTPVSSTMTQLTKGSLNAMVSFPYVEIGYAAVDALARKAAGVAIVSISSLPGWLVTKETAPTGAFPYPVVPNAVQQFKALWHVS